MLKLFPSTKNRGFFFLNQVYSSIGQPVSHSFAPQRAGDAER